MGGLVAESGYNGYNGYKGEKWGEKWPKRRKKRYFETKFGQVV
jgi:hypothetical protein